jgi:hypothetical protein
MWSGWASGLGSAVAGQPQHADPAPLEAVRPRVHETLNSGDLLGPDEVWPRPTRPRVLPRDIAVLLERLPAAQRTELARRLTNVAPVAPLDARVLGRAVGYLFVQRSTIRIREPDAFERSVDMIRKRRATGDANGYTATALLLVEWRADGEEAPVVRARPDLVPDDVAPPQFLTTMIDRVLAATPVTYHVAVRERRERRAIPVTEDGASALPDADTAGPGRWATAQASGGPTRSTPGG